MGDGGFKKLGDLFPTKTSFVIFVAYMVLFINQGILVTATKTADNKYNYSTITVVMFTECLKLFASVIFYSRNNSVIHLPSEIIKHGKVLALYFVPAALYCLYNNLAFVNLATFDPTTYYLLLQFRVVVTGIIFQILFKKQLSRKQWISLLLLTLGCVIKQLNMPPQSKSANGEASKSARLSLIFSFWLILLQVFCSCFAGVYNEYLLKGAGVDVHIMLQNIFMYVDSIICNFIALIVHGEVSTAFTKEAIRSIFQPMIIAVMINNSGCGIITSLFLKSLNSILKTFASALELVFTAILCWIIFGIEVDVFTVAGISVVSYATFLYSQNPVVNKEQIVQETSKDGEDKLAENV